MVPAPSESDRRARESVNVTDANPDLGDFLVVFEDLNTSSEVRCEDSNSCGWIAPAGDHVTIQILSGDTNSAGAGYTFKLICPTGWTGGGTATFTFGTAYRSSCDGASLSSDGAATVTF
jgi:hypothetical protein